MTAGDVSAPTVDTSGVQEAPLPNALVTVACVTQLPHQVVPWPSICLTLLGMWPGAVLLARFTSTGAPAHWRGYVDAAIALWKAIALLGVGAYLGMHFGPILHRRMQAWAGAAPIDAPMRVRVDSAGIQIDGFASLPWSDIRRYDLPEAAVGQNAAFESAVYVYSAQHGRIRLGLDAQAVAPLLARYYQDPYAEPWRPDK